MKKLQKDKEQDNKLKKEQKKKLKIIIEKNPLKPKINQIDSTEPKKYNRNIMTHNSISTKEEIKKKLSPSKLRNKQNNKLNLLSSNTYKTNKLLSSNYLFLTCEANSQSNLDDKKITKKNKKLKNYSNGGERINPNEISSMFKKDRFKKTIIIDDEGNNNLNLNIDKDYDFKNILKNDNNTIISNSFSGNTDTNSLFMSSNKSYIENYNSKIYNRKSKENDIKQTIIDKNEEERRLLEYRKIFNLLNSNIEQFKKMFTNKESNDNNNSNNDKKNKKNKKIVIQNKKDSNNNSSRNRNNSLDKYKNNDKGKNIKKNLSEKNLSSKIMHNKSKNPSIFSPKRNQNNNNFDINNNCSFLESSIQDDFYQSLINQTFLQNISRTSFEMNIDDISNIPVEKVICDEEKKNDNKDLKMDVKKNVKNLEDKPLEEENKKKVKQKSLEKTNEEENNCNNFSNDFDKNNCLIF